MFRLWGKIWKDNHLVQDAVAEEAGDDTRTHKVFHTLDELCRERLQNVTVGDVERKIFRV